MNHIASRRTAKGESSPTVVQHERPSGKPLNIRPHRKLNLLLTFIMIAGLTLTFTACGKNDESTELIIGAASSLTDPLNALSEAYAARTGIRPQISFASSGTLRKQVEEGAPFDLLLLASPSDLNTISDAGLILDQTRRDLLSNQICFVSTNSGIAATIETLPDLLKSADKVALGDPASVPVGRYAMASLESLDLAALIDDKKLFAKDARQVLQYLNTGAVDAGFLFTTDAVLLEGEFSVLVLPNDTHEPILYPAAILSDSQHQAEASAFLDFLSSEEAVAVFESHGFSIPR